MRIGITGHSNLAPSAEPVVVQALTAVLSDTPSPLIGVSCLARGADQIFARVVLELGGQVEVVLPAADYRERKGIRNRYAAPDGPTPRAEPRTRGR